MAPGVCKTMKRQQGFTLVEIAIVLVIIGLILGGILKGQELVDSARVRSISNEISNTRTAWYAFQDRYNALPGDFSRAQAQIGASIANNGDGNGRVDTNNEVGGVWDHLAEAGFINGGYSGAGVAGDTLPCVSTVCPSNPFSGAYKITWGANGDGVQGNNSTAAASHEFITGDQIPVSILLQLDIKLDDGIANSGELRSHELTDSNCRTSSSSGNSNGNAGADWNIAGGSTNCAAVIRGF